MKPCIFHTPHILGWENVNQRKIFYQDCRIAGVAKLPREHGAWYKIKD